MHTRLFFAFICNFLVCTLFVVGTSAKNVQGVQDTSYSESSDSEAVSRSVYASLVDGSLVAMDWSSGEVLWRYSTGEPLVSSSASNDESPGVFPGLDGSLYTYLPPSPSSSSSKPAIQRLGLSCQELVAASPSLSPEGALVVGARTSHVHAIDSKTGRRVRSFHPHHAPADTSMGGHTSDPFDQEGEGQEWHFSGDPGGDAGGVQEDVVFFGRTEYVIRSLDAATGIERWNVTYTESHLLGHRMQTPPTQYLPPASEQWSSGASLALLEGDGRRGGLGPGRSKLPPPPGDTTHLGPPHTSLVIGASGVVRRLRSGGSGGMEEGSDVVWSSEELGAVPAVLFSWDGKRLIPPAHPSPSHITSQVLLGIAPSGQGAAGGGSASRGLFALPAHHVHDAARLEAPPPGGFTTFPTHSLPALPPGGSSGSSAPFSAPLVRVQVERAQDWMCAQELGINPTQALGRSPHNMQSLPPVTSALHGSGGADDASASSLQSNSALLIAAAGLVLGTSGVILWVVFATRRRKQSGKVDALDRQYSEKEREKEGEKRKRKKGRKGNSSTNKLSIPESPSVSNFEGGGGVLRVGRLEVFPTVLGLGSAGTVVFEGKLDGRPVAVKRVVGVFWERAKRESRALVRTDHHPNILRCHALEQDSHFLYLALERCVCPLAALYLEAPAHPGPNLDVDQQLPEGWKMLQGVPPAQGPLVEREGRSLSASHLVVLRDVVEGLAGMHAMGLMHRDLKPHNVLLTKHMRAKISDMGLAKWLSAAESPSWSCLSAGGGTSHDPGGQGGGGGAAGSVGWRAPEQLRGSAGGGGGGEGGGEPASVQPPLSCAVDLFSLGCLLHFCASLGRHPFGPHPVLREARILRGEWDHHHLHRLPEVQHVVNALLSSDPEARPSAAAVLDHPMWWTPDKRLTFLTDLSDRMELEDREEDLSMLEALEAGAPAALNFPWDSHLSPDLLTNLGRYRKYNTLSVRDLLRVIRNKSHHFRELPPPLQEELGPFPAGFVNYFLDRFPGLLLHVFHFAARHCACEPVLSKYFSSADLAAQLARHPPGEITHIATPSSAGVLTGDSTLPIPLIASQPPASSAPSLLSSSSSEVPGGQPASSTTVKHLISTSNGLGEKGDTCSAVPGEPLSVTYPQRPGQIECQFFARTGHCAYGSDCRFHHPLEKSHLEYNPAGLPIRPAERDCAFYVKTGKCKFGRPCKFNHPAVLKSVNPVG